MGKVSRWGRAGGGGGHTSVAFTINRAKNPRFTAANAKPTPSDERVRCQGLSTSMLIKNPKCQPSVPITLAVQSSKILAWR